MAEAAHGVVIESMWKLWMAITLVAFSKSKGWQKEKLVIAA